MHVRRRFVHMDDGGHDIVLSDPLIQKSSSPFKELPLFLWIQLVHELRRCREQRLHQYGTVGSRPAAGALDHLRIALFVFPVRFNEMIVIFGSIPVDVRIAFVFRLQPFVMAVLGGHAACRAFLESHDRVWHICLLCLIGVFKEHCNSACIQGLQC